ncbi:MAG: nicotinate phosphoribosyltransferase [Clostridia bacterium]|nr:nicotinate phosphoribosyltransferase [Clostridia bacterium]
MEKFNNLLIDFYELTMGQGYFNKQMHDNVAYFDLFFRRVPDNGSFVIANGVKKCVQFLEQFHFSDSDIEYLRSLNLFTEDYINCLKNIKFTGDMWAVEDGTVVFPNEPVITIRAPLLEAQLIETALLLYFNRSSLITTKASRIVRSAQGRAVMEFGTRRAQGESAAVDGALDTYIAGVNGTACTQSGKEFGIPVLGTMAHSFVQSFDTEYDAFKAYAESFPDACTLLVDTYNTLESGVKNAIKVHNEVLVPMGKRLKGIRIDSGDLAFLSKKARQMLDDAGIKDAKIVVSNSLDENIINSLILQGAPIDSFGVGENMITAKSNPVFGGVYKLVAIEKDKKIVPKIKISDNVEKVTNPHFKNIYRLYDKGHKLIADVLYVYDEDKPKGKLLLNHPDKNWVKKEIKNFEAVNLRVKMIENGHTIYTFPSIEETRKKVKLELATLWEEALRLENPHTYTVNLSDKLTQTKNDLLLGKSYEK